MNMSTATHQFITKEQSKYYLNLNQKYLIFIFQVSRAITTLGVPAVREKNYDVHQNKCC